MLKPIYLDYMSTTPADERVVSMMLRYLGKDNHFGNPASHSHSYGLMAAKAVEDAREQVAAVLNANPEEIIWTSGATEANNLAIKGSAHFYSRQGKHLITCAAEHKSVLEPLAQLQREGFEISYLKTNLNGFIDLQVLADALRSDTLLVSVMQVNNETGVIQDIAKIAEIVHSRGVLLHVDAAQSIGKTLLDVRKIPLDLVSLSAHKVYGPKGIGALYIRRKPRLRLEPLFHGGGQEQGLRAGTLPTHQIVGMGEAFRIAQVEYQMENTRLLSLRQRLWTGLTNHLENIFLNGDVNQRAAGNLNVSFSGADATALMQRMPELAVASGSACASGNGEPSHVLQAMGIEDALARCAIRFSLGRLTTEEEIDVAIQVVSRAVRQVRMTAPYK